MYRFIGADGRQYGPVSADQLRRWIAEGRANAQTQTFAEGATEWKPLGTLPEFAGLFAPPVPPPIGALSGSHVRTTNTLALWGMILGIVALVCCCFKLLLGVTGLVFSLIGLSQINNRPDIYEGRGLAIAGIVLSSIALVLGFLFLMLALANGSMHPYYHHMHVHHYINP